MIEERISHLVDKCAQLETTNAELKQLNDTLTSQLETIKATEKQNEEIKAMVITKIDGLMGKLDEFAVE
jgi:cell shape-determining protein MreC